MSEILRRTQVIKKGELKIALYDLENDILEEHDVAQEHPEIIEKVEKIMLAEHEPSEHFKLKAID